MTTLPPSVTVDAAFALALDHHRAGRAGPAGELYRAILARQPDHPEALLHLGILALDARDPAVAERHFRAALAGQPAWPTGTMALAQALVQQHRVAEAIQALDEGLRRSPGDAQLWNHLGMARQHQGDADGAVDAYRRAIAAAPEAIAPTFNLAATLHDLGRVDEAIPAYQALLAHAPDHVDALRNLGSLHRLRGEHDAAITCYRRALVVRPDEPGVLINLGNALADIGRTDEAEATYRRALEAQPQAAEAHAGLANLAIRNNRLEAALAASDAALAINPRLTAAHFTRSLALRDLGRGAEAADSFARTTALDPGHDEARLAGCFVHLPVIPETEDEIAQGRAAYRQALDALAAHYAALPPIRRARAAAAVGVAQPFHLAYHGEDDRDLQDRYGRLVCALMAARYPAWSVPPEVAPPAPGEPIRVGFVSGFFSDHSNWKVPLRGWVEQLDRRRFALFGYMTRTADDAETGAARAAFARFVQAPIGFEQLAERIRADRLHVLIYPEIGMDPISARLAALRLAPVQATSWGHPNTSGYPTLDAFLSSDRMEPPEAQTYYTERLVRLPNLSIHYTPVSGPATAPELPAAAQAPGSIVYLCTQSLSKFLPRHDAVFAAIAERLPAARFLFLARPSPAAGQRFLDRLRPAFAARGLDPDRHLVMLPAMSAEHYAGLHQAAHIFLDSLEWSGCNTTLEAIAHGLPVVTLPGRFMRGRHSAAILDQMGLGHRIATDLDDYIDRAVALGADPAARAAYGAEIRDRAPRLYGDPAPVEALGAFLEACARTGRVS